MCATKTNRSEFPLFYWKLDCDLDETVGCNVFALTARAAKGTKKKRGVTKGGRWLNKTAETRVRQHQKSFVSVIYIIVPVQIFFLFYLRALPSSAKRHYFECTLFCMHTKMKPETETTTPRYSLENAQFRRSHSRRFQYNWTLFLIAIQPNGFAMRRGGQC